METISNRLGINDYLFCYNSNYQRNDSYKETILTEKTNYKKKVKGEKNR